MKNDEYFNYGIYELSGEDRDNLDNINMTRNNENFWVHNMNNECNPYFLHARQLLFCILLFKNDLSEVFDSKSYFPIFPKEIIKPDNYRIITDTKVEYLQSPSTRNFVNSFILKNIDKGNSFEISREDNKKYPIFKMSLKHAFSFAISFIYQFNKHKLHKRDEDIVALKNTILETMLFLQSYMEKYRLNEIKNAIYQNHIAYMFLLRNADKNLKLFKIAQMNARYNKITSSETLNNLCKYLVLSYEEIIKLKQTISEVILYNDEFIKYCLNTDYHDPLYYLYLVMNSHAKEYYICRVDPKHSCIVNTDEYRNLSSKYRFFYENFTLNGYLEFCKKRTIELIEVELKTDAEVLQKTLNKYNVNSGFETSDISDEDKKKLIQLIDEYNSFKTKNVEIPQRIRMENDEGGEEFDIAPPKKFSRKTYWHEYYFSNWNILSAYVRPKDKKKSKKKDDGTENEYLDFLCKKAVEILPDFT